MSSSYLPESGSLGSGSVSLDDVESGDEDRSKRQKRPGACVACRTMKTKCIPSKSQKACRACLKASRQCIMSGPATPRRSTGQRFSELEKKIDKLTDMLAAKDRQISQESQSSILSGAADNAAYSASNTSHHREYSLRDNTSLNSGPFLNNASATYHANYHEIYCDVISQGKVNHQIAFMLFDHWNNNMSPLLPLVAFSFSTDAQQVRRAKPMLFLAILTAASASIKPSLQYELAQELSRQLAERIFVFGRNSLDLLQATIVYCQYYIRTHDRKVFASTQHIYAAIAMATDLGLDRQSKIDSMSDPMEAMEARRTWLGCYYIASCSATLLRRRSILYFTPYMEDCMGALLNGPDPLPGDELLCCLTRGQQIVEETSAVFRMVEDSTDIKFEDHSTQYQLKMLQRLLEKWKGSAPAFKETRLREHTLASVNLYIHEIAIQSYNRSIGSNKVVSEAIRASHFKSLCVCLEASHVILDIYLSLEPLLARSLPNIYLIWTMYAAVMLIKLSHFTETLASDSDIELPDIKAETYLDGMLAKLAVISIDGHYPQVEPFGMVFKKLRLWYSHKKMSCERDGAVCDMLGINPHIVTRSSEQGLTGDQEQLLVNGSNQTMTDIASHWDLTGNMDIAFDPLVYANTIWEDYPMDSLEMMEFDTYIQDDSYMRYLL